MKKAEVKATGEVRINPDIAPTFTPSTLYITCHNFCNSWHAITALANNVIETLEKKEYIEYWQRRIKTLKTRLAKGKVDADKATFDINQFQRILDGHTDKVTSLKKQIVDDLPAAVAEFPDFEKWFHYYEYDNKEKWAEELASDYMKRYYEMLDAAKFVISYAQNVAADIATPAVEVEEYAVTPEDDGSNDEPEEDFLATLDTSIDEDAEDDELIDEPEPNSTEVKATEETIENDLSAMFGQPEKTSYQDLRTKIQVSYRTGKNGRESKIWAMYRIDLRTRHEEFIKVDQATAKRMLEENGWTVKDFVKADKANKKARAKIKAYNDATSGRNTAGFAMKDPAKIERAAEYYGLTVEEIKAILAKVAEEKAQAKATVEESITEDDGSNDEPEEDFLATLDASIDEDEEDDELIDEPEPATQAETDNALASVETEVHKYNNIILKAENQISQVQCDGASGDIESLQAELDNAEKTLEKIREESPLEYEIVATKDAISETEYWIEHHSKGIDYFTNHYFNAEEAAKHQELLETEQARLEKLTVKLEALYRDRELKFEITEDTAEFEKEFKAALVNAIVTKLSTAEEKAEDYDVTPEAFEVAVQAEIDAAKENAEKLNPFSKYGSWYRDWERHAASATGEHYLTGERPNLIVTKVSEAKYNFRVQSESMAAENALVINREGYNESNRDQDALVVFYFNPQGKPAAFVKTYKTDTYVYYSGRGRRCTTEVNARLVFNKYVKTDRLEYALAVFNLTIEQLIEIHSKLATNEQATLAYNVIGKSYKVVEEYAVTPEDDGSNDEPEEDFLATLDTSIDEDAEDDELIDEPEPATQADIAAADSVPTFTPETLARPNRQFFVYGFHTLHFFTTEVTAIIKAEKNLKYHQGRINGLKKRFEQGKIDADNYALDMIQHQRWVDKVADNILFCEKEIVNNLPAAIAELPELEKFVKHYEPNGSGDYCNMLDAAKFVISYAQNVAADIATPAVEVEVQAEIDNATVQAATEMYNSPTANDIAKAVLIMKNCAKRGGFFILQIAQFAIRDLRKPLEKQTAEISKKNILPAKQEAIEQATNIYDTASIADIAKAYFLAQGKKYFKDDAKTISYFKTVLQIKSLVVLGLQVEEKIQENLKPSNYYYNIYDAECRMAEDCRCLTAVKRSFARKAKHHQTLANKAWKEHQKYFLEVFCGAAMYDQIEKSILYLCDTLGELEKSPSVETVTIDIQTDEISNEIAPEKVDSAKGDLPTAEEYFEANDFSSWKFGAVPRIQRDTQDNILKVESFGEFYINHKKWITEYKQERADLAAGRITKKELKYEDVPDFCNGEIFKPDEFLKEDYDALSESVAKLTANIAELEKAIAVLKNSDNAEYNKRAEVMINSLNKARDILATYKAILKGDDAQTTAKVSTCKDAQTTATVTTCDDTQKYLEPPAVEESGYNKFDSSKADLQEWISEVAEDKFKAAITAREKIIA